MSRKVLVPLVLPADPTAAMEAATKQYVDSKVGGTGYLPLTGGTVTGPLILTAGPYPTLALNVTGTTLFDGGVRFGQFGEDRYTGEIWVYNNMYIENGATIEMSGGGDFWLSGGGNLNVYGGKGIFDAGLETSLLGGIGVSGEVTLTSSLNANNHTFYGFPTPVNDDWVATKGYVDARYGTSIILKAVRTYTNDATWTKPADLVYAEVEVQGAGGGSGGAATTAASQAAVGGGGGGGGYSRKKIDAANLGATEAVTVGVGGTAAVAGANAGGTGGTSSFGSHCQATGGGGGAGSPAIAFNAGTCANPGAPGVGSGGDVNILGGWGNSGLAQSRVQRGNGGSSFLGGGIAVGGLIASGADGAVGHAPGCGGFGGMNAASQGTARAGGAGANGIIYVYEYCTTVVGTIDLDQRYVNATGDSMSGLLTASGWGERHRLAVPSGTAAASDYCYMSFYGEAGTRSGYILGGGAGYAATGIRLAADIGDIRFYTAGADRMMVQGAGHVFIAKTAADQLDIGHEFHTNGRAWHTTNTATAYCSINNIINGSAGEVFVDFRRSGTRIGWIIQNGTTGVSYGTGSHGPWKGEVTDLDDDEAIERIKQWRPVSYRWKLDKDGSPSESGTPSGERQHGFIAQELVEHQHDAVQVGRGKEGDEDFQPWGIDLSRLVPDMAAAVQALIRRIEALETASG